MTVDDIPLSSPFVLLTTRELQVATLLAVGHDRATIAATLDISDKTVDTFRGRVLRKLGCSSTAHLARLAIREGLVSSAAEDDAR